MNDPAHPIRYDTMKILKKKYKHQFYFIIGADMIEYLPKWHKIDELLKLINFVGVERPDYNQERAYPILMWKYTRMEVSSIMIRERIKGETFVI